MRLSQLALLAAFAVSAGAETRTLTLRQAVELALRQNLDLVLARLEEQKAALEVRVVGEPLLPRLYVGSGAAYTSGMPMSIDGASPAVIQGKAVRSLYNPVQSFQTAKAREDARGAAHATAALREEIALRTAVLFLDLERAGRSAAVAARQVEHLERAEASVRLRVESGHELPIEARRANLLVARARQRAAALEGNRRALARALAGVLGLAPAEAVAAAAEERPEQLLPAGEEEGVKLALAESRELRRLESELLASALAAKASRAERLPRVDLVAQYGLLAKFNNYEDYFARFQRHNVQFGASIQIPLFAGAAAEARAAQADLEGLRIRARLNAARGRIEAEQREAWQRLREVETGRELAKLELDLAREQVNLVLAQMDEGRATAKQLEEARFQENERWLEFYDARALVERARLEVLKGSGQLSAALR